MYNIYPHELCRGVYTVCIAIIFGIGALFSDNALAQIYTCVDAQGRHLTSDRPIINCLDREQKQLGSTGFVRRVVPPSYSVAELKEQERSRKQAQERAQQEKARKKALTALFQRYPTRESHQRERLKAAAEIELRIRDGRNRLQAIEKQRERLNKELAFYTKNPKKMPRVLRIRKKSLAENVKKSYQYIAIQRQELVDLHREFDQERDTLIPLWK